MLVAVKDRNIHQFSQALLDHNAFRRLNGFKIDAAPTFAQQLDAIDDLIGVFGGNLEIDRIDIGKALEQNSLAFHDRLCRQRAAIAEAEDRGSVRDYRNEIALRGVIVSSSFVLGDGKDWYGDTRGVCKRKVPLGCHRLRGDDFQLARTANAVKLQGFLVSKGRPTPADKGLGGHCYSMNATGVPGRTTLADATVMTQGKAAAAIDTVIHRRGHSIITNYFKCLSVTFAAPLPKNGYGEACGK